MKESYLERPGVHTEEFAGAHTLASPRSWLPAAVQHAERVAGLNALGLALALLAGLALRVWDLNAVGFNSDEVVYAGQAAAIAGDATLKPFFPMFRAHPLLFQFIVSLTYHSGVSELPARLLSALFGVATVFVVYLLGKLLYGPRAGVLAALVIALMPYHVLVSRQMILDGPLTFCATLTLYLLARYAVTLRPAWLYAVGSALGLTFLAKETGILLVGAVYAFLALAAHIRIRFRDLVLSLLCLGIVMAMLPLSVTLAGRTGTSASQNYLVWQLFRTPNHDWAFYPSVVTQAMGPAVVLAAFLGLLLLWRERSWREALLLAWIAVPVAFFELWPVKGFQYLLPAAPAVAALAGRTLSRWPPSHLASRRIRLGAARLQPVLAVVVLVTLAVPSWHRVQAATAGPLLAGSGGVPGGREAGEWVRAHIPEGAQLLTIGPSMANILEFYGQRRAYGLSVSTNPLHRNPTYQPVRNPDAQIRRGDFQYLVYDAFSADRSTHFTETLMKYVRRYHGRAVHTEYVNLAKPDGTTSLEPVIVIYEVRP